MEESLRRYWAAILAGRVQPIVRWDGVSPGLLLDPARADVPLTLLGFEACRLGQAPRWFESGHREQVVVLVEGRLEVDLGEQRFVGERLGGPFGASGLTPACAFYAPRGCRFALSGEGEAVVFSAPAFGAVPARFLRGGPPTSRGAATWRRDIVSLVQPGETSTNLVVGETLSPAGLWSGTPPHRHDADDPAGGQSDHEEIYYFRIEHDTPAPAGVQFLSHDGVERAYPIRDRSVAAIPGGMHPVVAGPAGDLLYVWGMAGPRGQPLRMWDVPETVFLKDVEAALAGADVSLDEQGEALLRSLRRECEHWRERG